MRFGFHLFGFDPSEFRDIAIACDEAGWDHLALADAPFYPEVVSVPYPASADGKRFWKLDEPVLDPWIAITHMATVTTRLRFMTAVLRMAIRKPLMEAKIACSVAAVANDRLSIGIGLGWMPEEYTFTNEEMKTRGARATEAVQILKLCFGGGFVEFHGKHYDFDRLIMEPHPKTKVPVYGGGYAEAAMRRAAQHCDGWVGLVHPYAEAAQIIGTLTTLRAEYGRQHEQFDIILHCPEAATVDDFKRLEDLGVTHSWVVPWKDSRAVTSTSAGVMSDVNPPLAVKVDAIHRYGDEIIAKFE